MIVDNNAVADQIVEYLRKELVLYESIISLLSVKKNLCREMTLTCSWAS